jgi:SMC interacting uncharacterized protein involved in chromosome segregation
MDLKQVEKYDLASLKRDLENREEQIKSLQWAIDEHKKVIKDLELMIAWKEQNDSENRFSS